MRSATSAMNLSTRENSFDPPNSLKKHKYRLPACHYVSLANG